MGFFHKVEVSALRPPASSGRPHACFLRVSHACGALRSGSVDVEEGPGEKTSVSTEENAAEHGGHPPATGRGLGGVHPANTSGSLPPGVLCAKTPDGTHGSSTGFRGVGACPAVHKAGRRSAGLKSEAAIAHQVAEFW
eukprot:5495564-Pyramimonas_sp.AAC.1